MKALRLVMRVVGFGVAIGVALQPVQAGERQTAAAVQVHHAGASGHRVALVKGEDRGLRIESGGPAMAGKLRIGVGSVGHGELLFVPVTPLGTEDGQRFQRRAEGEGRTETGPATSPRERKSVTFFRLDPKLGDVAVQPVIGGVNGAQLSVGF